MKNLGTLPESPGGDTPIKAIASATEAPPEPNYPSLSLSGKQSEALGLTGTETVGDTITIKLKCKVTRVGDYSPTKPGETPPIDLHITHGELDTNEEDEPETPEEDADETPEDEDQEVPNSRPKPRVLSPKDSGFGDLND